MRPSEDCIALLKRLEGFRPTPYLCSGKSWTIGYGATRYANGDRVQEGDQAVTPDQADALLRKLVAGVWGSVRGMVRPDLSQGQCDALTMLVYNIGETRFRTSTMLRLLNDRDFAGAAAEFPRWNKSDGKVSPGLVRRRKLERAVFEAAEQGAK